MVNRQYKIDICGPKGCGKSSFMLRHCTGDFLKECQNVSRVSLTFKSNEGDSYDLLVREHSHNDSDAMIIMFDICNFNDAISKTIEKLFSQNDKPKILCATKRDLINFHIKFKTHQQYVYNTLEDIIKKNNSKFYIISSKTCYDYEKPFTFLLRQLTCNQELCI